MLNLFSQTTIVVEDSGFQVAGGVLFIGLILLIISIVGLWKVFEKAGRPGWAAIVPIYNYWVLAEIAGKPGWYALVFLISWIPVLGTIAAIAVTILVSLGLAKAFGKEPVWSLLIIFLPFIALLILGFGNDKYKKPVSAPKAA